MIKTLFVPCSIFNSPDFNRLPFIPVVGCCARLMGNAQEKGEKEFLGEWTPARYLAFNFLGDLTECNFSGQAQRSLPGKKGIKA